MQESAKPQPNKETPGDVNSVDAEFDEMFEQMNTPEHQRAIDRMFNASPEELQEMIAEGRDADNDS